MFGQAAFEYIVIVGIVMMMLIPIWSYLIAVNGQATQSLYISQAQTAAQKLTSAAELVYTQGPPSQITLDVYIPKGLSGSSILNRTIVFNLYFDNGVTDVVSTTFVPINGSIPSSEGLYKFVVKALPGYANISSNISY